jgi:hypothetical protein
MYIHEPISEQSGAGRARSYVTRRGLGAVACLLIGTSAMLPAQGDGSIKFKQAWSRGSASAKDIRMATSPADLVIDTVARRLVVKNREQPLDISADRVTKLTFDVSSHMRGGLEPDNGGMLGALVGAVIAGGTVNDHWCVIDYLDDAGVSQRYLLEIGKKQASDVLALLRRLLPSAVEEVRFVEEQREAPQGDMAFTDDYDVTVQKENRPAIPTMHPESALVVVAAPTIELRDAGKGPQYRLYANRNIVAVNKPGTYAFFRLAPGTYSLLAKAGNISVLDVTVEAGKEYYFFENTFMGFSSSKVRLTRQAAVLVRQEITGMYFSEWHPKAP